MDGAWHHRLGRARWTIGICAAAAVVATAALLVPDGSGGPPPGAAPRPATSPAQPPGSRPPSPAVSPPRSTPSSAPAADPPARRGGGTPSRKPAIPYAPARRPSPARPSPTPPPPTRPAPPVPVPSEGVFDRTSPLPDGVPRQVGFFFGGDMDCPGQATKPRISLATGAVIPTEFLLCFYGFRAGRVTVTIRPPAGKAHTTRLRVSKGEDGGVSYRYPLRPGAAAGRYRITARQGSREAAVTYLVTYPTSPRLWLDRQGGCRAPGQDVHIYLAGFPARRTVMLNLYRGPYYQTSFPAETDAYGSGLVILRADHVPDAGPGWTMWGVSHPELGDTESVTPDPNVPGHTSTNVFCTMPAPVED